MVTGYELIFIIVEEGTKNRYPINSSSDLGAIRRALNIMDGHLGKGLEGHYELLGPDDRVIFESDPQTVR